MDFSFIVGISAFVGPVLSFIYEKFFGNMRGNWKFWLFGLVCIIMGGGLAVANGEIVFTKLAWDSTDAIFASLGNIFKWAGTILLAGQAYFFVVAKKKIETIEQLSTRRIIGTKETSRKN